MKGIIFIISAPSGAGKSSLLEAIFTELRSHHSINRVITYTTRQPRGTERDGYDYHFLNESTFERLISQGFFIEWSNAYGTYYGSPQSISGDLERGISTVLIVDRVGAEKIKSLVPDAVLIWITVSRIEVLRERLLRRGTETSEQIERRIKRAEIEINLEHNAPLYDYHILNDDFFIAREQLLALITHELNPRADSFKVVPRRIAMRQLKHSDDKSLEISAR